MPDRSGIGVSLPTLQDIANRAGVSTTTVSDVLSGRSRTVRRDAQVRAKLIREVAQQIGYRVNAAARSTRTGRFGAITLLLGTGYGRSTVPLLMFDAVLEILADHEMNLITVRLPDERLTDPGCVPLILRETHSDGLLIDYTHGIPQPLIDLIEQNRVPAVWLNTKRPFNCVRPDDLDAADRATRHLLNAGHRRITYIDFSHGADYATPHYSVADRESGYRKAMAQAGLAAMVVRADGFDVPSGSRFGFARQWLDSGPGCTAVVCYSGSASVPIMNAALSLGISVPRDLSIVSMDDSPILHNDLRLTTMVVPQPQIAREAIAMLLDRIESPHQSCDCRVIKFGFEPGATVAPA